MDVRIPSYRSIKSSGKEVTVFNFEVIVAQRTYYFEKRYSDILSLHKKLKKVISTPKFPPKQIRNRDQKVLETRRQALDNYFDTISYNGDYPQIFIDFFGIKNIPSYLQANIIKLSGSCQSLTTSLIHNHLLLPLQPEEVHHVYHMLELDNILFYVSSNGEAMDETDEEDHEAEPSATHCPVITFVGDPYFSPHDPHFRSNAVLGVLQAIYA